MRLPIPSLRSLARLPGARVARRHRSSIAVVLVAGLSTGMVRIGSEPVAAAAAAPIDEVVVVDEAPVEVDTRPRYLVVLHRPAPTTTTTTHAPTTTTAAAAHGTSEPEVHETLAPAVAAIPVTIRPGETTQQALVVRLDGSRVVVTVPVRYLSLVPDGAGPGGATAAGVPAGERLVRDRDGRYWSTDLGVSPAVLRELPGQLDPAPATDDHETHADAAPSEHASGAHATTTTVIHDTRATTTTDTHATDTHATDTHATDTHAATTTAVDHRDDTHATATTAADHHDSHGTTTAAHPAPKDAGAAHDGSLWPANVDGPVPDFAREAVMAIAALPGAELVRCIGGNVVEVRGDVDPAALAAIAGVERVYRDEGGSGAFARP